MKTKILKINKTDGVWRCLFVAVTGGVCYVTAQYIDEIIMQINEVNLELAEVIA